MNQKEKPPDKVTMMDYEETFGQGKDWENSRLWADEMMRDIPRLKEEFKLDQITLGDGQCFMTSCIQQLRRPDVKQLSGSKMETACQDYGPLGLQD